MIRVLKMISISTIFLLCTAIGTYGYAGQHEGHSGSHHKKCSRDISQPCATSSKAKQQRRMDTVVGLYEDLIYPGPKAVLSDHTNADHIFEQSVIKGRVTPAGYYSDFEGAIEYFYGLALTPQSRVDDIKVRSITASGDAVAIEVDLHFCQAPFAACDPEVPDDASNNTLRQIGFYTFNANDKVISFDLAILSLGKSSNPQSEQEKAATIMGVCTVLTTAHFNVVTEQVVYGGTCTDYFDGAEDFPEGFPVTAGDAMTNCVAYMSSIPYGTWDQPSSDTFTCRSLHSLLTPLRSMHCMHVSVDGGGKCVDSDYGDFFDKEF